MKLTTEEQTTIVQAKRDFEDKLKVIAKAYNLDIHVRIELTIEK